MTDLDFASIFEQLPDALAVCDDEGRLTAMNARARELLGAKAGDTVHLDLRARETVRQIRLTDAASQEFYLADVQVTGARRARVSASLHPLDGGGYRVTLSGDGPSGTLTPNLRMMEALVNVGRHLELFRTADKTLALFEACFADIFPEYSFRIVLDGEVLHEHSAWGGGATGQPFDVDPRGLVRVEELAFDGAAAGWRAPMHGHSGVRGYLQVERQSTEKFRVSERQAFETFNQQLSLALGRVTVDRDVAVGPIIDQLDAIVVVCDSRRRIQVVNRTFETLAGSHGVAGRDIVDFFEASGAAKIRTTAAGVMAGQEADVFEAGLLHAGRSPVSLRIQIAANRSGESDKAAGFILTGQQSEVNLVEIEARMTRAEQLLNVGQLASGVAHELKNPLTSILNYAEYLLMKYQDSLFEDRDSDRLRRIIEGVERIDTFVNDLVVLARPSETEVSQTVDLHAVVRESGLICEVALRQSQTQFQVDLADRPLRVMGSPHQLKQVFVNLITNATKAMEEEPGTIKISTWSDDGMVYAEVADDATGMSAETMGHIFEPFFTTRAGRGGSGVGLALVKTIIERHGGSVSVDSELGIGTTFTIVLPEAE